MDHDVSLSAISVFSAVFRNGDFREPKSTIPINAPLMNVIGLVYLNHQEWIPRNASSLIFDAQNNLDVLRDNVVSFTDAAIGNHAIGEFELGVWPTSEHVLQLRVARNNKRITAANVVVVLDSLLFQSDAMRWQIAFRNVNDRKALTVSGICWNPI